LPAPVNRYLPAPTAFPLLNMLPIPNSISTQLVFPLLAFRPGVAGVSTPTRSSESRPAAREGFHRRTSPRGTRGAAGRNQCRCPSGGTCTTHQSSAHNYLPSPVMLSPALSSLGCLDRTAGSFHAAHRSGSATPIEEEWEEGVGACPMENTDRAERGTSSNIGMAAALGEFRNWSTFDGQI